MRPRGFWAGFWALLALWLSVPSAIAAEPAPVSAHILDRRIGALLPLFKGKPTPPGLFAPVFVNDVPDEKLQRIAAELRSKFGQPRSVKRLIRRGPGGATVRLRYARADLLARLALEPEAPHRITGLRITDTLAPEKSLTDVTGAIKHLPGITGLALTRLDDGKRLAAITPDRPLAGASSFKLVILAEISRAVAAGEMRWDDRAAIDVSPTSKRSAPVRDLAEKMISVSDNGSADSLAAFIGRERLEAMMVRLGVADPARNRPFLTVVELFKLKSAAGAPIADRWSSADETARRAMLDNEVAALPVSAIEHRLFQDGRPIRIDSIEWFFTANDMVRILDWFRREGDSESRRILALNPGVGPSLAEGLPYIGYKGGSEPGVMAMNLLIRDHAERWYALALLWNDSARAVDEARLVALVSRIVERISRGAVR